MPAALEVKGAGPTTNKDVHPGTSLAAVTPSDSVIQKYRALWVGTGGDVAVVAVHDDDAVTLVNVPDGTLLPIAVKKVMDTNTDALNIVGIV